ncbi:hypothetical protein BDW02DRAFT_361844 [Decorospora gaudefroyi]|uniref:Uncharacterized protein n=1 Tax=Decorospora gaudefroyi TaxID=184978 RepID=A0A6A5KJL9_9PLEO|nr:hypothetical protein BDW02DRAFT_361844 [Decorospora gaudefroyi]
MASHSALGSSLSLPLLLPPSCQPTPGRACRWRAPQCTLSATSPAIGRSTQTSKSLACKTQLQRHAQATAFAWDRSLTGRRYMSCPCHHAALHPILNPSPPLVLDSWPAPLGKHGQPTFLVWSTMPSCFSFARLASC